VTHLTRWQRARNTTAVVVVAAAAAAADDDDDDNVSRHLSSHLLNTSTR